MVPALAQAGAPAFLTPEEQRWLVAHPVIRLAPDPQFLPIEFFDEQGTYVGIAADYVSQIERLLGVKFETVRLDSWESVLQHSRDRKVDIWGAAVATPQRLQYMNFSKPYLELPAVILVRQRVTENLNLKTLQRMKVAVISGYGVHDHILNEFPEIQLDVVPDINTGLKKVSMGLVDALVANIALATTYIEKEGIANLRIAGESGFVYRWSLASRNDWPELNAILDKALARIDSQKRQAIYNQWVQLPASSKSLREIAVSLAVVLAILGVTAIVLWNRSLSRQVESRTGELKGELEERTRMEKALRQSEQKFKQLFSQLKYIVQGTSTATGEEFFKSLVYHLSHALNVKYAFVGELKDAEKGLIKTLAFWTGTGYSENLTYEVEHTPCEHVFKGGWSSFPSGVGQKFPEDRFLMELGIESYQGIPITDAEGRVLGHLGVMDDKPIQEAPANQMILAVFASRACAEMERINTGRHLIQAREDAEKASRAKSDFLSRMSHEFRTPLNAILGFSQLMNYKRETLSPDHLECLDQVMYSGKHLKALVEEVLDLSKVESSHLKLTLEPVPVSEAVDEACLLTRSLAEEYGIQVVNSIDRESGVRVQADPLRLRQVLINLITNAIKYNRENGAVTLEESYLPGGRYRIEIRDTGKGIKEEELEKIFNPFERLGAEFSEILGTGIGLTLCQSLVTQMDGSLKVESEPGQGSCFSVELPVVSSGLPSSSLHKSL